MAALRFDLFGNDLFLTLEHSYQTISNNRVISHHPIGNHYIVFYYMESNCHAIGVICYDTL